MATLGKLNVLTVVRGAPHGAYLDGGEHGEILLPMGQVPPGTAPDTTLEVFVHRDSEDRLIATTQRPLAMAGDFAALRVVAVHPRAGAFLDWGLPKHLLLPYAEQEGRVREGDTVVVHVVLDPKSDRLIASARLGRHASRQPAPWRAGSPVNLLVANRTPLGWNAVVENSHLGLIFRRPGDPPLAAGQALRGYVTSVRPGGKIDLSLDAAGYQRVEPLADQILAALKAAGGRLDFDDDSSPERIRETFGASKKAFKQALGALFRQKRLRFTHPGIELIDITRPAEGDWRPGGAGH